MVVDDSSMNLKMAERALQDVCKPILVPSGRLALKYLENNDADLILILCIYCTNGSTYVLGNVLLQKPKKKISKETKSINSSIVY